MTSLITRRRLAAVVVFAALAGLTVNAPPAHALPRLNAFWVKATHGPFHHASPTLEDVNGDGAADIVIGDLNGWIHVYKRDGSKMPGWPQPAIYPGGRKAAAIESTAAVADLDGDGRREIIVGTGSLSRPGHHGGILVFNRNGTRRCGFRTLDIANQWTGGPAEGYSDGVFSSPAIGDITGNGTPEIVFGSWDQRIYALGRTCHVVPGFPFNNTDTVWSSPALFDADRDGRREIFIGGDSTVPRGGVMRRLDWGGAGGGRVYVKWQRRIGEIIQSSPAIGDINGDGRRELVVGAGLYYRNADSNRVYAWRINDGSTVPGWPRSVGGNTFSSPALGDITGDGVQDVVMAARDQRVYAFKGNGYLLWKRGIGGGDLLSSPIIADANGNTRRDVIIGTSGSVWLLNGANGSALYEPIHSNYAFQNAPAVSLYRDGSYRLFIAGFKPALDGGVLASYRLPQAGIYSHWPMFRRNPLHWGTYR